MADKIKRATNFTSNEEQLLVNLVQQKYAGVIENKRTDTGSNKIKNEAWVRLSDEFNSLSGEQYRDTSSLKNKYGNLKKRTKEKFAQQKRYAYGTGGGPPKDIVDTPVDISFKEIIGTQITGMSSEFDGDVSTCQDTTAHLPEEILVGNIDISDDEVNGQISIDWTRNPTFSVQGENKIDENTEPCGSKSEPSGSKCEPSGSKGEPSGSKGEPFGLKCGPSGSKLIKGGDNVNWANYTPTQLRTPISNNLKRKRKEEVSLRGRIEEWACAKKKIAVLSESHVTEQNSLKLEFMKEAHYKKMQQESEKHELQIKHMKELHELDVQKKKLEIEILNKKS